MLKEFKEFAIKGNMMDMAVGIIIGAAFGTVVNSLVTDLLMPLISGIIGSPRSSNVRTTGGGTNFLAADGVSATYTRAAGETVCRRCGSSRNRSDLLTFWISSVSRIVSPTR